MEWWRILGISLMVGCAAMLIELTSDPAQTFIAGTTTAAVALYVWTWRKGNH